MIALPDGVPSACGVLRTALAEYLSAELKLGRIAADASPEAAATMVMGACHELILPRVFAPGPQEPLAVRPGFKDDLVTTVLRGIVPGSTPAPLP